MGIIRNVSKWPNGSTITIKFIESPNCDQAIKSKIISYAKTWEKFVHIKFNFVEPAQNAIVRIKVIVGRGGGGHSFMGTDARYVHRQTDPTMFLYCFNPKDLKDIERSVLHEFGHMLSLAHEHCHKDAPLDWLAMSREAKFNNHNFGMINDNNHTFTPYDCKSIMHYPIPARLTTTKPRRDIILSTKLSQGDINTIRKAYPGGPMPSAGNKRVPVVPTGNKGNKKMAPALPAGNKGNKKIAPALPAGNKGNKKITPVLPAGNKGNKK